MGILGWFTRNRGFGKITKVAVLVAALATACQSRSEKFVQLNLQIVLKAAKKAGFDKTADAASNALINIRGLLAK